MIREDAMFDRLTLYSSRYIREELIRMRDLQARIDEYGGYALLLADIEKLSTMVGETV